MPTATAIEDHLREIRDAMAKGQKEHPADMVRMLIGNLGRVELATWQQDFRKLIREFEPKPPAKSGGRAMRRYRDLKDLLDDKLAANRGRPSPEIAERQAEYVIDYDSPSLAAFRDSLDNLQRKHFQWTTSYKDCLDRHLATAIKDAKNEASPHTASEAWGRALSDHANKIFSQGYSFARDKHIGHEEALHKALNGLRSFLRLPLEFYSERISSADAHDATVLRSVCSGAFAGIVNGFASATFGSASGGRCLDDAPQAWLSYLGFMTHRDAASVRKRMGTGLLADAIDASVAPVLHAIDLLGEGQRPAIAPMPVECQFAESPKRRLDIYLRPPGPATNTTPRVASFLEDASTADIEDCWRNRVRLIVAPMRPDATSSLKKKPEMVDALVSAGDKPDEKTNQCIRVLDDVFLQYVSAWRGGGPLTYNFAREFPLQKPDEARHFHVTRTSVRDLLRVSDREGSRVRLWCSIRRSGKTTACVDLESGSDGTIILKETCGAKTGDASDAFVRGFKDALKDAKTNDVAIDDGFVFDLVRSCIPHVDDAGKKESDRIVLILDEYETLFRHFRANEDNEKVRLNILEPFLNQLLAFSMHNLVVFLGQQPDAHFVLMDQNQLAPYVKQEAFPLFEHRVNTTSGEFAEFIGRVFGGRLEFSPGFADELFEEVAGHPWLTVNVLVAFVEWLIERRWSASDAVDDHDFVRFREAKLDDGGVALQPEFAFFRDYITRNMSTRAFKTNPWVYAVYWILHYLGEGSVDKDGFRALVDRVPKPNGREIRPWTEILMQAAMANFLSFDGKSVSSRIRILGRLAASSRPQVD